MSLHPAGRLDLDSLQLQRVLTQVPFAVVMFEGPEHKAVFSNAAHDEMTGGRLRLGVPLLVSLPELAGQPVMDALDAVYATGQARSADQVSAQLVRGGRIEDCWFRVTWQPVNDYTGQTIGVIVSSIEVTHEVVSQQALDAARAEAEHLAELASQTERHFHEVADNLPVLVWSANAGGDVDYYNRRWYEYTGTTWENMQTAGWQAVHAPDHHAQFLARWQESLTSGESFEMEFALRRSDGTFCPFVTRVMPLTTAAGELVRWCALISESPARRSGSSRQ